MSKYTKKVQLDPSITLSESAPYRTRCSETAESLDQDYSAASVRPHPCPARSKNLGQRPVPASGRGGVLGQLATAATRNR
jgi:hypothetical protein